MTTICRFERVADGRPVIVVHRDMGPFDDWACFRTQWEVVNGPTIVTDYPVMDRNPGTAHERLLYEAGVLEQEHGLRLVGTVE